MNWKPTNPGLTLHNIVNATLRVTCSRGCQWITIVFDNGEDLAQGSEQFELTLHAENPETLQQLCTQLESASGTLWNYPDRPKEKGDE